MKPIERKPEWPEILAVQVQKGYKRKFKYGTHDCCMFAANTARALTGRDLAKKLRGYTTREGAYRMLQKVGKRTLVKTLDWVMAENKCPKSPAALCRRGDIVIAKVPVEDGKLEYAAGVCVGDVALFAGDGLVAVPMSEVSRGWHIG